jgi:O-acetyl-ADP-ribose deacetylase (regulator of RNase III)
MALTYIQKDVTTVVRGVVGQGVNSRGVMGSGVALAIKNKWAIAYERYHSMVKAWKRPTRELLGLSQIVNVGHPDIDEPNSIFVANMFTQEDCGRDGRAYASQLAIQKAAEATLSFCRGTNLDLYMPRVGCGLGGLKWENVGPMIDTLQQQYNVNVFICDLYPLTDK